MFEEELQTLLVIRAYGQSIDTPVRAAIVRLNQISPTRLPLRQLVAASKFLSVTDQGVVSISIPTIEKVEHWFNVAVAMVSLVLILICSIALVLIMPSVADHAGAVRAVKLIGLIAVFTSSLAYVAAQSRPHVAARRIAADVASASKMITSAPAGVSASVLSEKVRTGKSAHRA